MTDSKLYEIAEGSAIAADVREDLARELDFAAAADTLYTAAAEFMDNRREALAEAQAAMDRAEQRLGTASRAQAQADRKVDAIMTAAGLVRTAEGIMTRPEAEGRQAARAADACAGAELAAPSLADALRDSFRTARTALRPAVTPNAFSEAELADALRSDPWGVLGLDPEDLLS
jgi:hypothetical protein